MASHVAAGRTTSLRVLATAWGVLAVAVCALAMGHLRVVTADGWVVLVSALGVALATAIPILAQITVDDDTAQVHIGVLVPAVFLLPWSSLVLAVTAGVAGGWLLRQVPGLRSAPPASRPTDVISSVGRATLAAAAAGGVGELAPQARSLQFVVAVVGALTFLAAARLLVWIGDAVVGPDEDLPTATLSRGLHPVEIQVVALAYGFVTALVVAAYPGPALWFALLMTLGTAIAMGMSAIDTARAHHAALLRISSRAHASMDLAGVERAVHDNLAPLVQALRVDVREAPPEPHEIGQPLPLPGDPAWLVATPRGHTARTFTQRDRRLIASATPLVATAVENARLHDAMTARATTDPLTGIANRRAFDDQLRLLLQRNRASDGATALVVFDVDDFKAVNDEISHRAGDLLLAEVARRLTSGVRREDLVARLGGDEFAVVATLVSLDEEDGLRRRLERRLADLRAVDGRPVGVSLGVAVAPRDGRSARHLYDAADARMYAVKRRDGQPSR